MTSNDNEGDDDRHDDLDELLTLHEVAELLRVPDATVRWWRTPAHRAQQLQDRPPRPYFRTEALRWIREQGAGAA